MSEVKEQIRNWLEEQIKKAQGPNDRERILRQRKMKAKKEAKKYGL